MHDSGLLAYKATNKTKSGKTMFTRQNETYDCSPDIVAGILVDEANPLNRISNIIPNDVKVLDIGAGNGLLALVLKATHRNILVDGIEPNSYASQLAKKNYRNSYL